MEIYTRLTILDFFYLMQPRQPHIEQCQNSYSLFSKSGTKTIFFFLYKRSYVSQKTLFYAYLTSFYQINVVRHLWFNLEKNILNEVTVKSGYKDETKLFSTEKYLLRLCLPYFFHSSALQNLKKSNFKNKLHSLHSNFKAA